MKRYLVAAATYAGLGLAAGLYYRTLTHSRDFHGQSQLVFAHTHLLALGTLMFLVLAALDGLLHFSGSKLAKVFAGHYHAGMALTVGTMLVGGTLTVLGISFPAAAIAGVAGLGHILLTVAFVLLFVVLIKSASAAESTPAAA